MVGAPAAASLQGGDVAPLQQHVLELQEQLKEVRGQMRRQEEQAAAAMQLVEQQARTIEALSERLMGAPPTVEPSASASSGTAAPPGQAGPGEAAVVLEAAGGLAAGRVAGPAGGLQAEALEQWAPAISSLSSMMEPSILEQQVYGVYGAAWAATPKEHKLLPKRIVLVRHAQSKGNVDPFAYECVPDPSVPLTHRGWEQAIDAGTRLRRMLDADGEPYTLFFHTSPYLRCRQTTEGLVQAFTAEQLLGVQEEVQLREQDFSGGFQDAASKEREKLERLRYGRFFYRFPQGESGADVYNRMTTFQDHLVRDINAGRFGENCNLVLVTHGLAARIFLQRWLHWTVDQLLQVYNPPNAEPIVLERVDLGPHCPLNRSIDGTTSMSAGSYVRGGYWSVDGGLGGWVHTKALYRLSEASRAHLRGCTDAMCSTTWYPQGMRGPHWQPPQPPPRIITDSDTEHDDIPWSGYVPA